MFNNTRDTFSFLLNDRGLLGLGVEVGVHVGEYAEIILRHWQGKQMILVDPWYYSYGGASGDARYEEAVQRMSQFGERSLLFRSSSVVAATTFADESIDWVYLDGDHSYTAATCDLFAWYPKLRPGGMISGHDYIDLKGETFPLDQNQIPNQPLDVSEMKLFGVRSAVRDFREYHKLTNELLLTKENPESPTSFYWFK